MTLLKNIYKSLCTKAALGVGVGMAKAVAVVFVLLLSMPVCAQKYVITEMAKQKFEKERIAQLDKKNSDQPKLQLKEKKKNIIEVFMEDSTAWINGVEINIDLVGPACCAMADKKYFEAAGKLSIKDRIFPIVELGYGFTDYEEPTSTIAYKANGVYGRLGFDFNMLKDKHDIYQFFLGTRLGATSFNYDVAAPSTEDPVWGGNSNYQKKGATCSYLWLEFLAGVDAKVIGPVHLGWTARYKKRISHSYTGLNKAWYVPGYGDDDSSGFQATFTVGVDIFDFIKKKK